MIPEDLERWPAFKAWLRSLPNRDPISSRAVVTLLAVGTDDFLLDIGCGPGLALQHAAAAGARPAGIDPSSSMVSRAARRVPEADVKVGAAEDIPFPDATFTAVMNLSSYHHWTDSGAGLSEVFRVLAPGGRLAIVEASLKDGREGHGLNPADVRQLKAHLEASGYAAVSAGRLKVGWTRKFFVVNAVRPPV